MEIIIGLRIIVVGAFCLPMALNVVFLNVWGIMLKEWKECSKKTVAVLITGVVVRTESSFLPQPI